MTFFPKWTQLLIVLPVLLLMGCQFGEVNQGRVIEYDSEKGVVTYIRDSNYMDPNNPKYDLLPPITIRIPEKPKEMGPEPTAGKRMTIDFDKKEIVIFNDQTQDFEAVKYTLIEQHDGMFRDHAMVAGKTFPIVDREQKTITVYSYRQLALTRFSVPDEYFDLPDETWRAGDEIRYYYKDPEQALRLMNVTRTDIFGH